MRRILDVDVIFTLAVLALIIYRVCSLLFYFILARAGFFKV
jgi:hypothetical protein